MSRSSILQFDKYAESSPKFGNTSKESSGIESPIPRALMNASLRAQHLKNPASLNDCGKASSVATSLGEKNLLATSSDATELSINSISTPTSRSIPTATRFNAPE